MNEVSCFSANAATLAKGFDQVGCLLSVHGACRMDNDVDWKGSGFWSLVWIYLCTLILRHSCEYSLLVGEIKQNQIDSELG